MASNLPEPAPGAYLLNHIFHFPTPSGPTLAVSVSATNASSLLSFYSILVKSAVGQLWAIVIIVGVYISLRRPPASQSHNAVVASVGVLNAKRPLEVGELSFNYLCKLKRNSPWSLLLWLVTSIFALIASAGVPTLVGRYIVVGHGAPANPDSIYVPANNDADTALAFRVNALEVPSALRAAGSVQPVNLTTHSENVQIDDPVKLEDRLDVGEGEYTSRYGYRYQVTARDFGLQHYNGLTLYVEGSCVTEYGWLLDPPPEGTDNLTDVYSLWNNASRLLDISIYNAPMPIAYFKTDDELSSGDGSHSNTSFAIIVSSVGRKSFTAGKDPFYLTKPNKDDDGKYTVWNARPVLSCWQSDTWVYKNQRFSVTELSSGNGSLAGFPKGLNLVFTRFLAVPKINTLGIRLGASALLSAAGSLGETFDAGSASIQSDLTRLVLASYIATTNTLADMTLFRSSSTTGTDVPNLFEGSELNDVAGFVLYSKEVSALSVSALASIPLVVVAMFLIAYLVTSRPWFPWYAVQGYQATILYSFLDERLFGSASPSAADAEKDHSSSSYTWKRKSIAWFKGVSDKHASIVPGAHGQPTLVLADGTGTAAPAQAPHGRNGDTQPSKESGSTLEITAV